MAFPRPPLTRMAEVAGRTRLLVVAGVAFALERGTAP
jgi:hypothetical protein